MLEGNIDAAIVSLYLFWAFFAGLIFYLRREDKREGYPLESDRSANVRVVGYPELADPKVFHLADGTTQLAPREENDTREILAEPTGPWPGAPLQPTGDPMRDGVGPAAYAMRKDIPDMTFEGEPKIVPMRVATDYGVESRDPDPRGLQVVGADNVVAGTVSDLWVDRGEALIRYLEVELPAADGDGEAGANPKHVLLPVPLSRVRARGLRREVKVCSILAEHFSAVPSLKNPDQVTRLEEDKITAYYASGHLYALPWRAEPII